MYQIRIIIVLLSVIVLNCRASVTKVDETSENINNLDAKHAGISANIRNVNSTARKARVKNSVYYAEFSSCVISRDVGCFLDVADGLVEEKRLELLAEADTQALQATGRSDQQSTPSLLADLIGNMFGEIGNLFSYGFSGFFRTGKEDDDEDDLIQEVKKGVKKIMKYNRGDDQLEDDKPVASSGRRVREGARKKKKKEKIKAIIKLLVIGAVIKAKITLLLKLLAAKLQIKFFLVALAGLILNAARFYLDLKKGHQPQKVIYYEHAQHQHHYEGGEDDWQSSPGGGYWGRTYDEDDEGNGHHGQNLAYAKQKPSSNSWF